jgi:hypothetical protein
LGYNFYLVDEIEDSRRVLGREVDDSEDTELAEEEELLLGAHIKGRRLRGNSTTILLRRAFSQQLASQNQDSLEATNSSVSSPLAGQQF